tara:strand:- start:227 stop:874 length:648 start_codon:yes stop_codon:yes gene_type:complete
MQTISVKIVSIIEAADDKALKRKRGVEAKEALAALLESSLIIEDLGKDILVAVEAALRATAPQRELKGKSEAIIEIEKIRLTRLLREMRLRNAKIKSDTHQIVASLVRVPEKKRIQASYKQLVELLVASSDENKKIADRFIKEQLAEKAGRVKEELEIQITRLGESNGIVRMMQRFFTSIKNAISKTLNSIQPSIDTSKKLAAKIGKLAAQSKAA